MWYSVPVPPGMLDTFVSWEDTRDPQGCNYGPEHYAEHSRDPARTPMQWDNSTLAGGTLQGPRTDPHAVGQLHSSRLAESANQE